MSKRKIPESVLPRRRSRKRKSLPVDADEVIARIAGEIRTTYIRERKVFEQTKTGNLSTYRPAAHWDGGRNKAGHRRPNIWRRIAVFCLRRGLDHRNHVRSLFLCWEGVRNPPQPNLLVSERYLDTFRQARDGHVAVDPLQCVLTRLSYEKLRLDDALGDLEDFVAGDPVRVTENDIQRAVLGNEHLDLSPLFRLCLAAKTKHGDIVDYFCASAIMQYLRFPEQYDAVWEGLIPTWFRDIAMKCRAKFEEAANSEQRGVPHEA